MTPGTFLPDAPDLAADDYIVVGLATCFVKQDGKLQPVQLLEPIPSAALEAIIKGIPTSYEMAIATKLGDVFDGQTVRIPQSFTDSTQVCDDFAERVVATARSYKSRPAAQAHLATGQTKSDFNYSTERKRTLNSERIVSNEDNVKQHSHTHKVL